MYNDENDINFFGSYRTTTEETTDTINHQTLDYPQTQTTTSTEKKDKFDLGIDDDYSVNQNFEEQKNYDMKTYETNFVNTEKDTRFRPIDMPLIEKEEEVKVEAKPNAQISLSARMKLVLVSFIVIISSLLFATVWNFITVAKINSSMNEKLTAINELQVSITELTDEYNLLGNSEHLKQLMEEAGFIESNDSNTINISLDDMYTEHKIEEIPSNWFNDVCNFITSLFK